MTFSPETAKHIRIEVKHSAGDQTDAYINAAAIDIYKAEEVVAEDKVISKPVLTAVAPVTGEKPADVTATDPKGYTVATAWTDSDGNTVTKFEAGQNYTLTIALKAEEGNIFDETSIPEKIQVGEKEVAVNASDVVILEKGKTMTLTLVFSVPAETTKPSDKEYGKLEGLTGKADSEERIHDNQGEDGATSNALDGKTDTYWHTN